ncbi:uncharacterized protein Bfra_012252 [Botrytis fragariae]|uniref:Uncharacterized protein n=1 Tax=Botrytis fragariae TaxID=1964551 RepID=A0A8H6EE59_9HELO|nr:uncharacterized protein Bfra_012252 [Botrytis fragariae]KAF5868605.1 hypothetical protein Bfra_012252 [Botrytis fragariae]
MHQSLSAHLFLVGNIGRYGNLPVTKIIFKRYPEDNNLDSGIISRVTIDVEDVWFCISLHVCWFGICGAYGNLAIEARGWFCILNYGDASRAGEDL